MEPTPQNAHGFFESKLVARLNDDFLEATGSSWHDWRTIDLLGPGVLSWTERRDAAVDLIDAEFGAAAHIVLKDPRICRLAPIWIDALSRRPYRLLPVLIHRNPFEVALSLQARNGFPFAFCLLLWLRHVLDAESATRSLPRAFTSYDQILADWRGMVDALGRRLDLTFPLETESAGPAVDAFLSTSLRHFKVDPRYEGETVNPTLLDHIRDCQEIMDRWVVHGEDPADHAQLDRLSAVLAEAGWTYMPVATPKVVNIKQITAELLVLRTRCENLEAQFKCDSARQAVFEQTMAGMTGKLEAARIRCAELEVQRDQAVQRPVWLQRIIVGIRESVIRLARRNRTSGDANERQTKGLGTLAQVSAAPVSGTEIRPVMSVPTVHPTAAADKQLRIMNAQLTKARTAQQVAERRCRALLESKSWRLTAPLRHLVRTVSKWLA